MGNLGFSVGTCKMNEIKTKTVQVGKKQKCIAIIYPNGDECVPTKRFWKSFQMRFRINRNVFNYFSHAEVFNRISETQPNDKVRYAVEKVTRPDGSIRPRAMAVTNPLNPAIQLPTLVNLLNNNKTDNVDPSYSDGVIQSRHIPSRTQKLEIAGDWFENRFYCNTPIDGFGRPQIFIGLLRQVCTNGAIAMAPAFRSEVSVGKKNDSVEFALERMLQSFNSEDGYVALHDRFRSAAKSWASVYEAMNLHKTIVAQYQKGGLKKEAGKLVIGSDGAIETSTTPIMKKFMNLTGNLNSIYAVPNINALSVKRQKTLPATCTMYDLINFASEVSTHHCAAPSSSRAIQGFIGGSIVEEYDLEGTKDKYSDYKDFFVGNSDTADTLADMSSLN